MSTPSCKSFDQIAGSEAAPKDVRHPVAADGESGHQDEPDPPIARPVDQSRHEEKALSAPSPNAPQAHVADRPDRRFDDDFEHRCRTPAGEGAKARTRSQEETARQLEMALKAHIEAYEVDLGRLEAALSGARRGQGEGRVSRLPRAPQLSPVAGIRSPGDMQVDRFRSPRLLEPSFALPLLIRGRSSHLGIVLGVLAVSALSASTAYLVLNYLEPARGASTAMRANVATVETQIGAAPSLPAAQSKAARPLPVAQAPKQSPVHSQEQLAPSRYRLQSIAPTQASPHETNGLAPAPQSARVSPEAVLLSAPSPTSAAPLANPRGPPINREEIEMLLTQGEHFISVGDVATARVLFGRAAEAGDGTAALALGATYDPGVLAKLGVRGIVPDAEKARRWYQKARELGSPEAPSWLAKLAVR